VKEEDFDKPFVAIVNSYVECCARACAFAGVRQTCEGRGPYCGGVPFEFNTIGVDDGIAMGIWDEVFAAFAGIDRRLRGDDDRSPRFDAMVCIPNCDKIVPGMLLDAMR